MQGPLTSLLLPMPISRKGSPKWARRVVWLQGQHGKCVSSGASSSTGLVTGINQLEQIGLYAVQGKQGKLFFFFYYSWSCANNLSVIKVCIHSVPILQFLSFWNSNGFLYEHSPWRKSLQVLDPLNPTKASSDRSLEEKTKPLKTSWVKVEKKRALTLWNKADWLWAGVLW